MSETACTFASLDASGLMISPFSRLANGTLALLIASSGRASDCQSKMSSFVLNLTSLGRMLLVRSASITSSAVLSDSAGFDAVSVVVAVADSVGVGSVFFASAEAGLSSSLSTPSLSPLFTSEGSSVVSEGVSGAKVSSVETGFSPSFVVVTAVTLRSG